MHQQYGLHLMLVVSARPMGQWSESAVQVVFGPYACGLGSVFLCGIPAWRGTGDRECGAWQFRKKNVVVGCGRGGPRVGVEERICTNVMRVELCGF